MGYNSIFSIRFSDLDAIAADPDFGVNLTQLALRGTRDYYARWDLSSITNISAAYDMSCSCMTHSSGITMALLGPQGLTGCLNATRNSPLTLEDWRAAAGKLAELGYASRAAEADITCPAQPVEEQTLERRLEMEQARREAFLADPDGAQVSMIVMHDALFQLERDKGIGERLKTAIQTGVKIWPVLIEHAKQGLPFGHSGKDVALGMHGNGLSIIEITPAGWTDLVVAGGNWGRLLEPVPALRAFADPSRVEFIAKLREKDIADLRSRISDAGFLVRRPGRSRSDSASYWNKDSWVRDAPAPAEIDAGASPEP